MNQSISEEFDERFRGYWRGEAIPDEIKFFLQSKISQAITADRKELRERVAGAVARGCCHDKNSMKEMDADLAEAIIEEILLLL